MVTALQEISNITCFASFQPAAAFRKDNPVSMRQFWRYCQLGIMMGNRTSRRMAHIEDMRGFLKGMDTTIEREGDRV
jgi:hypothetical protein